MALSWSWMRRCEPTCGRSYSCPSLEKLSLDGSPSLLQSFAIITSPHPKIIMNSPFMKRALSVRDLERRWIVLVERENKNACGSGEKELSERHGTEVKPPNILPLLFLMSDRLGPLWSHKWWNYLAVNPSLDARNNNYAFSISIPICNSHFWS